ncbi:MAG: hypothetical protein ACREEM_24900 [Blastocatellia bacterium]
MTKRFNAAGYVIEETDGLGQQSKIERNLTTSLATKTTGPCGCLEAERTFDYDANGFMNSDVVKRNSDQAVISQTIYELRRSRFIHFRTRP